MIRTAIIDDDPAIVEHIAAQIAAAGDICVVGTASTRAEGDVLVTRGGYDVLVCDLGLPDGEGETLIRHSAANWPEADIMVVTVFAAHHKVIGAIKAGARSYILKDEDLDGCADAIREMRGGGSPISPIIARLVLSELQPALPQEAVHLTEREHETLNLLARGFTDAECAGILGISAHTIGTYVKSIYRKLEVRSRAEAVYEASQRGMLGGH
jgi:DNA-binding NarL/FixJ family response regulator